MKTYQGPITVELSKNTKNILCFGSNTQGKHGKGTALLALKHFGAKYGEPKGLHGRSYGIITKDLTKYNHPSISPEYIKEQIFNLYLFAIERPEYDFYIPYMNNNQNLNAYSSYELANMFNQQPIPNNIIFEISFAILLHELNTSNTF